VAATGRDCVGSRPIRNLRIHGGRVIFEPAGRALDVIIQRIGSD
jgi:hypothetical protein